MNNYKPEDLKQDTRQFVKSQYGGHVISTLVGMAAGFLANASNITEDYPARHIAKYSAIQEVLAFIKQPIMDDDTSQRK